MNFNKILKALFGDKSARDMHLIQPLVEKVKAVYPEIQALSNDELRQKTKEIQKFVQAAANEENEKIARKLSSRHHSTSASLYSTRLTSSRKKR